MSAFPQPWTSTVSHWQATNRGPDSLFGYAKDDPLPEEVDVLIIGAGMSYWLTRPGAFGEGKKIVLVEAKDLASGATGRNGGHCGPASFSAFPGLVRPLSQGGAGIAPDLACHVLENEHDTLNCVTRMAQDEGIEFDLWRGEKIDVTTTQAGVDHARNAQKAAVAARRDCARYKNLDNEEKLPWEWEFVDDPEQAKKISRLPTALSISRGQAGSLHPHKLATGLVKLALASKTSEFSFFSWCPVKTVTRSAKGDGYIVDCHDRGIIQAKKVILTTNAHSKHLFPQDEWLEGISSHITPFRGHAGNITTTLPYSGVDALEHTYFIEDGPYLINTTNAGIIMGPSNGTVMRDNVVPQREFFEQVDDSVIQPEFVRWLGAYCKNNFEGWGEEAPGEGLTRTWSGIMAASHDLLPLVESVPNKADLYACVAFHGHGMARILTSTRGLAHLLSTGEWDGRLPVCFDITEDRLRRVRQEVPTFIPEEVWGARKEQTPAQKPEWIQSRSAEKAEVNVKNGVDPMRGL